MPSSPTHHADTVGICPDAHDMFGLVNAGAEPEFDSIVALAASMVDMPHAYVSFRDRAGHWLKASHRFGPCDLSGDDVLRDIVCASNEPLFVKDVAADARFCGKTPTISGMSVRAYAAIPIRAAGAAGAPEAIGTLSVFDTAPASFSAHTERALNHLGCLVETIVKARAMARHATEIGALAQEQAGRIARQEMVFREAERMALIGAWRLDLTSNSVSWSNGIYRIHDLSPGKMPSLAEALDYYPPAARAIVSERLTDTIETGTPFDFETDFVTANGDLRRVRSRGEREDHDGRPIAVFGVFQDVTEQHAITMRLKRSAEVDALTGIANRAAFNDAATKAVAIAHERDTPLMLVLIDLDSFKAVNDTFGHLAGDTVLRAVGRTLQAPWLEGAFVARLGGDEFAVIVTDPAMIDDRATFAARLEDDLARPVTTKTTTIATGGSAGTALLGKDDTLHDLIHIADTNLYAAKRRRIGERRHGNRRHVA